MNIVKRYYIIELELDEDHEGAPDNDEVCLHLEQDLLSNVDEFGIKDAKCAPFEPVHIPEGHSRNWLLKKLKDRK